MIEVSTHNMYLYLRSMVELDLLIHSGEDEDSRGDHIRDDMDSYWYRMNEEDCSFARHIGAEIGRYARDKEDYVG